MIKLRMLLCAGLLLAAALGSRTQAQPNLRLPQVPQDSAVRIGRLPNGLTYYIRHNALPEQRADFYIVQKVAPFRKRSRSVAWRIFWNTCALTARSTSG